MGGRTSKAAAAPTAAAGAASAADAHMTPASIKKLFEEIDEDKSGTLEKEEVRHMLARLKLPSYLAERMMSEADVNHDGKIDLAEFTEWATQKEAEIEKLFSEIDTDHSRSISRAEIDAWLAAHRVKASAEDEAKLIDKFHHSPAGEISYAEFRDLLIFFNPTDFALLADDWMHHASADDLGVHVHTASGAAAPTATGDTLKAKFLSSAAVSGYAGAISAAISRTAVAPLERLRFQMITDGAKYGGSSLAALKGIVAEEGVAGFWRGNLANMQRIIPQARAREPRARVRPARRDLF